MMHALTVKDLQIRHDMHDKSISEAIMTTVTKKQREKKSRSEGPNNN